MSALLALDGLATAYGQSRVLWDVGLEIEAGGAMAVIGRNGVGKTTLMKCIIGLQPATGGFVRFAGADLTRQPAFLRARAGIGYVPQGRQIFPHLTVEENLRTGRAAAGGRATESGIPAYVYELFPKLADIRKRKGGVLSGGEQQQLAIGRALVGAPRLLLLDEPTEGIQPNVVQQIEDALRRIRADLGVAIIIVEQYLDFAWSFADHYSVMQGGRIVRRGTTAAESAAEVAHLVSI
jgi:urea transport system ATP-binding protein